VDTQTKVSIQRKVIMWWTPNGERILQGAEARLLQRGPGVIVRHGPRRQRGTLEIFLPALRQAPANQKTGRSRRGGQRPLAGASAHAQADGVREGSGGAVYEAILLMWRWRSTEPVEDHGSPTLREIVLALSGTVGVESFSNPHTEMSTRLRDLLIV